MDRRLSLLFIGVALTGAAEPSDLCRRATPVLSLSCVETGFGVALARDPARARELLNLAETGVTRFQQRFGTPTGLYAVYEPAGRPPTGAEVTALRTAGFNNVLPWPAQEDRSAQIEAALRKSVAERLAAQSPEAIEGATKKALEGASRFIGRGASNQLEAGVVPHELGHQWYSHMFWPNTVIDERRHYGGPGPDWLDETAAVMMEEPTMFGDRIGQFAQQYQLYRNDPAKAPDAVRRMVDLPRFFHENHPAENEQRELIEKARKENGGRAPIIITGTVTKNINDGSGRIITFYLQCAVASQYFTERSGDPKVFARIGAAFGRGETIEQWLANAEPKGKLPRDLNALQTDWLAWLDKRFPATAAKPAA